MADSPNTPSLTEFHSRRSALAGIAGTLALATTAVGAVAVQSARADNNPDADLIALCQSYCVAWKAWEDMADRNVPNEEFEAFSTETLMPLYDELKSVPPKTLLGVVAKAKAALLYEYDYADEGEEGDYEEQGKWLIQQLAKLEAVS